MARLDRADRDRSEAPAAGREFRLSDAMILLAGAALSLAGGAHLAAFLGEEVGRLGAAFWSHREDLFEHWPVARGALRNPLVNTLWYGFQAAEMALVGMTPAFGSNAKASVPWSGISLRPLAR